MPAYMIPHSSKRVPSSLVSSKTRTCAIKVAHVLGLATRIDPSNAWVTRQFLTLVFSARIGYDYDSTPRLPRDRVYVRPG
jgi:hypothetical protein